MTCKIIRHYFDRPNVVIDTGLSLDEAQAHCQRDDTHGDGWFDGYTVENPTPEELDDRAERDADLLDACLRIDNLLAAV